MAGAHCGGKEGYMEGKNSLGRVLTAIIAAVTAIVCVLILTSQFTGYKKTANSMGLTATGSASCDFESDLVVWRGRFSAYGLTTGEAYGVIKSDAGIVKNYLLAKGVTEDEFVLSSVSISPHYRSEYDVSGEYVGEVADGYDLNQQVTITSSDIDKVEGISRDISELIESGVEFTSDAPEYYYTKLDELKLDLIEKATENAKQRIDIMAAGSGTAAGELLTANLGVFQITAKNSGLGEYSYDGAYDVSSRYKTASITVRLNYSVE